MRKKKEHHEEHADETWLLPYSDMMTLLLALFIVMFAMGQTDKAKLQQMSEQFNIIFAGGSATLEGDGNSVIPMNKSGEESGSEISNTQMEEDKMAQIKKTLEQEIEKEGNADKVKVELNNEGLGISIQDVVLFNSGDAEILKDVSPLLSKISGMLKDLDNQIKVTGHTDNVPIKNDKFRSNWDLSSMRAINVMNFIVDSGKINPEKLSIQAYGEYSPKFDNSTDDGRAKNRRVEIFVTRNYPVTNKDELN